MLTQLADISTGKSRAEKRVFELGYPNRDTGRTGRVTTLSFLCSVLGDPAKTPEPQRLTLCGSRTDHNWALGVPERGPERDGVIFVAFFFFYPWTETSKTPCSFLKARQKQQTPSTESRHNLGLEETLRRNVGQRGGIYIHGRWRHYLYRNDPTKSDFIKHRNVFSLVFIFFVFVPKMDGWSCFSFHLNIHM